VLVNGRTADPADRVAAGDVVEFEIPAAYAIEASAEPISLDVVYEDEDLAVIDKPAGMVVHPAPGHYTGTLVNALLGRGGTWSVVQGYSANATYNWNSTGAPAGTELFGVWVRATGSSVAYDSYVSLPYTLG